MGGGGKRKSRGGGGRGSRKRRTPAAARKEESLPNSDIDEPQVEDIIKVELHSESDSGLNSNQPEVFDEPINQELASDQDIDIGEVDVKVLQYPEDQFVLEAPIQDSNMINEPITPNIDPDDGEGETIDGAPSTSNQPDCILSLSVPENGGEITRLTGELQATTSQNKLLQQKVDSKSFRIQEPSSKIKLLEDDVRNCAECKVLKDELEKARSEAEALQRQLHTKSVDLERQTSRAKMLEEEQRRLVQENSRTVNRLEEEISRKTNLLTGGSKEEIKQLNTENEHLNNSVNPQPACEHRLQDQDDNDDLRRVIITEKEMFRQQHEEANGKIEELKRSILAKDNELVEFKARYFRDKEGNSQLHLAVKIGDEQAIEDLIQLGADVNAKNSDAETPIFLVGASDLDDAVAFRMVKSLIEQGANVFATDRKRQTFLHKFASTESRVTPSQFHDISSYLVSKNLQRLFTNTRNASPVCTPLMLAVVNAKLQPRTASLLHKNGVHFRLAGNYGKYAVLCYTLEVLNNPKMLQGTVNPEQTTEAAHGEVVKLLVRFGADINERDKYSMTPLYHAAGLKNVTFAINTVKFLINFGANVDAHYGRDKTPWPFMHSIIHPHYPHTTPINPTQFHDIAAFLISKNLSRLFNIPAHGEDSPTYEKATPFQLAVERVEIERATLSMLKDNGVDFNAVDKFGQSVLFYATRGNQSLRLISDLVDLGANPSHLYNGKNTMLHQAASEGRPDLLKFFLEKGLDINAQGNNGYTPLHSALWPSLKSNAFKTVQFLLRNGANSGIKSGSFSQSVSPREHFEIHRDEFPDADKISTCFSLGASC